MEIRLCHTLDEIPASQWNALLTDDNPFLRHAFLSALEHQQCIGGQSGWHPHYLLASDNQQLLGALPMYLKDHSFGEFVFDWSWANAYTRAGLAYYPKLVVATPFTPVTGNRLLIPESSRQGVVADTLVTKALEHAQTINASSLHFLFCNKIDARRLHHHGFMLRTDHQFHWENNNYRDFDDFLASFSSRHRKKIKRERKRIEEENIHTQVLHGEDIREEHWDQFYTFYRSTFLKKGHYIPLTSAFFKELGKCMPENIVLILASHNNRYIAGAINFLGGDTLYGRYWGCHQNFHSLHFELCYYRAIDYCIKKGLQRFEAGAQGEHKLQRGFKPTTTLSAHWIAHPEFRHAVDDFLTRERHAMSQYKSTLEKYLPYKSLS